MNKTSEVYAEINRQYDALSKNIDNAIIKTTNGWELPQTELAILPKLHSPWNYCDPTAKSRPLIVGRLVWKGNNYHDFESELSKHLFYELADYFTPEKLLFYVCKKNPDVDGYEGCRSEYRHFSKIGKAIRYAQELIARHFRNKTAKIDFPEFYYLTDTKCFDDGPYANSVVIECRKIE